MQASPELSRAGAILRIDLDALCANWQDLRARLAPGTRCAAVLKADAYGLGAHRVGPALYEAGCRHFFVAHTAEGITLRSLLPDAARIYVLHGPVPGSETDFLAHHLIPVLNSPRQIEGWQTLARHRGQTLPAVLQVDTGMARMGLAPADLAALPELARCPGIEWLFVMSHLAVAEDPAHPANAEQLERFRHALARFPGVEGCLANSSGIFLGADYHFGMVRPGAALYGVAPQVGQPNPMRPVIQLCSRIIQLRDIAAGTPVGYGQSWCAQRPSRIATITVGYADGYLRSLGNRGQVYYGSQALPVVGKVSMDTLTIDVTDLPPDTLQEGEFLDLACPWQGVDAIADQAGTIGYEVLTSLGRRYTRIYTRSTAPATAGT
ncbi:MAG: alanine racemase [Zoogloea sp.]|uniref:alanine racemase n=1 Tax=Zoogloea sp. TaxID=49181 RepID=UPI003F2CBE4A